MKHITIKDIAKHLNISVSTVSRAFNDKYDIRAGTRDLILATAKEMGYRPNPIARKLIKQQSLTVGIVVPEFENAFFPQVIIGAQEVLHKNKFQALVMQSSESAEMERENVQTLVDNMVDGLIVSLASETENLEFYQELIDKKMPIVFFNRVSEQLNTSKVLFDDYKWAFFATEHLLHQGIKNIVHLACPQKLGFAINRINGFKDAHRKHNIEPGEIIKCGFSVQDGERVAGELIAKNTIPEAIFSASDFSAIGAMKIFKRNGFKIPKDIAVVGFSESRLANYMEPPLTTVSQPTVTIGQTAAELLLTQLNSKGIFVPQTIILNGNLVVRESSMKNLYS